MQQVQGVRAMHVIRNCPSCGTETRCSRREFSEQAWAVLVIWGEIEESVVDQAVCQSCYEELRDILIDRAGEIEQSLRDPKSVQKPAVSARRAVSEAKTAEVKKSAVAESKKVTAAPAKKAAAATGKKTEKTKKTKKVSRLAS
jgi:hypothetical protein